MNGNSRVVRLILLIAFLFSVIGISSTFLALVPGRTLQEVKLCKMITSVFFPAY